MPTRLRALLAVAALLAPASACDPPLEPGDLAATYALASVGGSPLPAVVVDNEFGRVETLADTLRFRPDGRGTRVTVSRHRPAGGSGPAPATRIESVFAYRMDGARLEISFICPPNALCIAGPHLTGRADAVEVLLTGGAAHPRSGDFRYRRAVP